MKKLLIVFIIAFCMVLCACGKDNTFDDPANLQKKESNLEIEGGVDTDQLLNYNSTSTETETTDSKVNVEKNENNSEIEGGVDTDQPLNYNSTSTKTDITDSEVSNNTCTNKNNSTNEIQDVTDSDFNDIESDQKESTSECNCKCQCSNIGIDMADAILIAQNHLFAMLPPEFSLDIAYSAWYLSDNEETWTILIGKDDVNPNDEYDYIVKGGGYTYVIDKATGKILEIRSGE